MQQIYSGNAINYGVGTVSFTVLVTAPTLAIEGRRVLDEAGCRAIFLPEQGGDAQLERILRSERIEAVISRTMKLTAPLIRSCLALKVISRHGIGYDNVDVTAATERGIPVLVTPATNCQAVVELTMGLMLAVARGIPAHDNAIRAGAWPRTGYSLQLSGLTLGLVGFGGIGRAVASAAHALGMHILIFDPIMKPDDRQQFERAKTLEALLARADVLSLHCPLTVETRHLIDEAALSQLKAGALVINTARGGLVDESALVRALDSGRVAGAGLDTLELEPIAPDHPFKRMSNVVLTPHVGGSTGAALGATAALAAKHALLVLRGEPIPPNVCVNFADLEEKSFA